MAFTIVDAMSLLLEPPFLRRPAAFFLPFPVNRARFGSPASSCSDRVMNSEHVLSTTGAIRFAPAGPRPGIIYALALLVCPVNRDRPLHFDEIYHIVSGGGVSRIGFPLARRCAYQSNMASTRAGAAELAEECDMPAHCPAHCRKAETGSDRIDCGDLPESAGPMISRMGSGAPAADACATGSTGAQ